MGTNFISRSNGSSDINKNSYNHHFNINFTLYQHLSNHQIHSKINSLNIYIMETSKTLIGYAIYLPIAIALTFYVSKTLFRNSKIYMLDIFKGREEIANATNKLFETGFYLLNLGFALLILEMNIYQDSYQLLIEKVSYKIGGFTIYLGVMLFLNLYFFFRGKRKSNENKIEEKIIFHG